MANIVFEETMQAITTNVSGLLGNIFFCTQVEDALCKTKAGSAPEPDSIPIDLLRLTNVGSAIQFNV